MEGVASKGFQVVILFIFLQFYVPEPDSIWKQIKVTNEKELYVEVELNSFEVKVLPLPKVKDDVLADIKMKYDSVSFLGSMKYEKNKGIGRIVIKGEKKNEEGDLFGFIPTSQDKNICNLSFTHKFPLYLDMKIDMGSSNIDLSGLKVAKLNLSTSGNTTICFNSPNPIVCKDMYISAPMSRFEGKLLGNARFNVFHFHGGVGSYTLDFRGEFKGTKRVEIMMGVGSLKLILPKEVGVKLKPTGVGLKSIGGPAHKYVQDDEGWYQSENWGTTDSELIIHIDGSFGIVRVETL